MKHIFNCLSENLIAEILTDLKHSFGQNVWGNSSLKWDKNVTYGLPNSVIIRELSPYLKEKIQKELLNILPPHQSLVCQLYLWPLLSGITWHNDENENRVFGATIYLNRSWDINWGGLFVYQHQNSQELAAILPTYNTIIINENFDNHMVTPVTLAAQEYRVTLQLFGHSV